MLRANMDAVSGVIDSIYGAGYDDSGWPEALDNVRTLFAASGVCIGRAETDLEAGDVLAAPSDPAFQTAYVDHYSRHNLLWQAAQRLSPGTIYSHDIPLSRSTLRRSMFWNEWMAPQDYNSTLGCTIRDDSGAIWLFDIERASWQSDFENADVDLMKIIGRSMQKAMSLRHRLGSARVERSHAVSALNALSIGAMVVDGQGRVHHLNDMASALLSEAGEIFLWEQGNICLRDPHCRKRWAGQLVSCPANSFT